MSAVAHMPVRVVPVRWEPSPAREARGGRYAHLECRDEVRSNETPSGGAAARGCEASAPLRD
jgi:hypothetical protein